MKNPKIELQKGTALPELKKSPITQEQLRRYAAASLDHNPIHLDAEAARNAGLPGVIAHGMLTMGFMSEFLWQALEQLGWKNGRIFEMDCRFKSMVFPQDEVTIHGTIKDAPGAEKLVCDLTATTQRGEVVATGHGVLVHS